MTSETITKVDNLRKAYGSSLSNNDLAFYLNTLNLNIVEYKDAYDYYNQIGKFAKLSFVEAFNKFCKGQLVKNYTWIDPHSGNEYRGGAAIMFENGYTFMSHGCGAGGTDINTSYILDEGGNTIASEDNY